MFGSMSGLNPRARGVVRAFYEARGMAPGFLLSCGLFPEVSEPGTDRLHRIVHDLASRHLGRNGHARALRGSLRSVSPAASRDRLEREFTALLASETTAAYIFGLAAGLGIGSLQDCLKP